MTCGADDMRAYRINARLSDPVIIIIFLFLCTYIFFCPVRFQCSPLVVQSRNTICPRRPTTSGTGRFFIRVQNQIRVPAGRKYRLCAARRPLPPPPAPHSIAIARPPVASCHEQSRFPILFRALLLNYLYKDSSGDSQRAFIGRRGTTALLFFYSTFFDNIMRFDIKNILLCVPRYRYRKGYVCLRLFFYLFFSFTHKCSGIDYFAVRSTIG